MNKIRQLIFPENFNPDDYETECVSFIIPKGLEFRMAVRAVLSALHKQANWQRDEQRRAARISGIFRSNIMNTLVFDECAPVDCSALIACLSNPSFKGALIDLLNDELQNGTTINTTINQIVQNGGSGYLMPNSIRNKPVVPEGNPCNLDNLWGRCLSIVQFLNRNTVDFFETIEQVTNNQEAVAEIIKFIPVLGDIIPIPELLSVADNLRAFFVDAYLASYDVNVENQIACDLFCRFRDNCNFTLNDVAQYFIEKVDEQTTLNLENILENAAIAIDILLTNNLNNTIVVQAMFAAQLGLVNSLSSAFGFNPDQLFISTQLGIDSNDWQILCIDCGWTSVVDFAISDYGYTPINTFVVGTGGIYSGGTWTTQYARTSTHALRIVQLRKLLSGTGIVTSVKYEFEHTRGAWINGSAAFAMSSASQFSVGQITSQFQNGSIVHEWTGSMPVDQRIDFRILAGIRNGTTDPNGNVVLRRIIYTGTGQKPPELP